MQRGNICTYILFGSVNSRVKMLQVHFASLV